MSLDFDDKHLPKYQGIACFDTEKMKQFFKALRNRIGSFRYLYATDFGGLLRRPHYHLIVLPEAHLAKSKFLDAVRMSWHNGHYFDVDVIESVNNNRLKAIQYVVSYTTKDITFSLDEELKHQKEVDSLPMRYRPRVQASKGFGLRALEESIITPDTLRNNAKISIPIGKNGKLVSFAVPRYYEMKLAYDYKWHPEEQRAELTKNEFGQELDLIRTNGRYVYQVKAFFSSRLVPIHRREDILMPPGYHSWRDVVYDCLEDFDDFKTFVWYRPYIKRIIGSRVYTTVDDSIFDAPNWRFYEQCFYTFEKYMQLIDDTKYKVEMEHLAEQARLRAIAKLKRYPSKLRYLVHIGYDFNRLYNPNSNVNLKIA